MNIENVTPRIKGHDLACRKFKAIINQAGTAAPTFATGSPVLNQLLDSGAPPTLARTSAGLYTMTLTGAFAGYVFGTAAAENGSTGFYARLIKTSANVLTIQVLAAAGTAADLVGNMGLDIEVWPA